MDAADNIKNQDLEYEVSYSGVKEIDDCLSSIDEKCIEGFFGTSMEDRAGKKQTDGYQYVAEAIRIEDIFDDIRKQALGLAEVYHFITELWDGVLYKALSDYQKVSDNEMKDIIDFAAYENAIQIFKSGFLLSVINARKLPDTILQKEKRNAANDPVDFFHYIMFSWENCQAGDRLVMERKLGKCICGYHS